MWEVWIRCCLVDRKCQCEADAKVQVVCRMLAVECPRLQGSYSEGILRMEEDPAFLYGYAWQGTRCKEEGRDVGCFFFCWVLLERG